MKHELLDTVVLVHDLPKLGLRASDVRAIADTDLVAVRTIARSA